MVRETVAVVVALGNVGAVEAGCVCASTNVAAKRIKETETTDKFFTGFSIWGRLRMNLIFLIFFEAMRIAKNRKR